MLTENTFPPQSRSTTKQVEKCFAKNLAKLISDETPNQMGIMINSYFGTF